MSLLESVSAVHPEHHTPYTDVDAALSFYRDLLGLELVEQRDGVAFLRCSRDHQRGRFVA